MCYRMCEIKISISDPVILRNCKLNPCGTILESLSSIFMLTKKILLSCATTRKSGAAAGDFKDNFLRFRVFIKLMSGSPVFWVLH